jgi:hypothetical protein
MTVYNLELKNKTVCYEKSGKNGNNIRGKT